MAIDPTLLSQGLALVQVIFIDVVMAGDNAVAVGIAAAGLAPDKRRLAIVYGLIGAVILRIGFVLLTVELLNIVGLLLAGGVLLLWVCWKMWRELIEHHETQAAEAAVVDAAKANIGLDDPDMAAKVAAAEAKARAAAKSGKTKTLLSATLQILAADISMSLDNVLAVAGAAQHHVPILVFGLLLSIAAMGVAANFIANILHKYRWIAYAGVAVVLLVALKMIWEGGHQIWEFGHCDTTLKCVPVMARDMGTWWHQFFAGLLTKA
ncbi:YjbE family putative metal transport protein [Asticcacaulis sp. AC466]|uniref:YjbE family putative metal transport protein n=1 Tax=Asticcacaulis sp. AC466 TaxID=1282362 RepID=UPI0004CEF650|nr:YjbE family putative metal transport protein [Asticcacaulis sp. AC466]